MIKDFLFDGGLYAGPVTRDFANWKEYVLLPTCGTLDLTQTYILKVSRMDVLKSSDYFRFSCFSELPFKACSVSGWCFSSR